MMQPLLQSFSPVARADAKILVLGSMPGAISLAKQQYYAHPRNAFWGIIAALFGLADDCGYEDRLLALQQHHIALWDVIHRCQRRGSLDSQIANDSLLTQDFAAFFAEHPHLEQLFFNGSRAALDYQKHVLPYLPTTWQQLPRTRLPSTSPAMASLTFEQKLTAWRVIAQRL